MGRQERSLHKNFIDYQYFIANHSNYLSLPNKFNKSGEITWVRVKDKSRTEWWDNLKVQLKLPDRASVARAIHPKELKGMKPCQVCGKMLSINYRYLNESSFKYLRQLIPSLEDNRLKYTIEDIAHIISNFEVTDFSRLLVTATNESQGFNKVTLNNIDFIFNSNLLSPGVMSNAPDRLDGFHTYNACCRTVQDTGRNKSNLARYSQDRRAYENWAEGNWRAANRLMGKYASYQKQINCPGCGKVSKMTADHIGPISLGFTHRMKFKPLCINCNSSKNNRLTLDDVKILIEDENHGELVVSWHSQYLWNELKNRIETDEDALKLSVLMRRNLHSVLTILAIILENNGQDFLRDFLHPEYAFLEYDFSSFDPATGIFEVKEYRVESKNSVKNAERYIRISMDSLGEYSNKKNRRILEVENKNLSTHLNALTNHIKNEDFKNARNVLMNTLKVNALSLSNLF